MAWTTPKTDFDPGDVLTAAELNAIGENIALVPHTLSSGALTAGGSISISDAADYGQIEISLLVRTNRAAIVNDLIYLRLNADTGNNYDSYYQIDNTTATTRAENRGTNTAVIGYTPAASAPASYFASYRLLVTDPGATTAFKNVIVNTGFSQSTGAANIFSGNAFAQWRSTAAITSISFGSVNGAAFVAGSSYTVIGYPKA